jgi:plasmid maintenance system antidote protein VapI
MNPLAKYLLDNDLTQTEFATALGVTKMRVSQIAKHGPATFAVAERIEDATGIPAIAWINWRRAEIRSGRSPAKRKKGKTK